MKPIRAEKCYISDKLPPLHILLTEEDAVIVIRCLDFSISSHGDTIKEARESMNSTLMDYLKHAIENNSLDNLFDSDLKEYWDMYHQLEIEAEKHIFQANVDKIKGEILSKGLTYA